MQETQLQSLSLENPLEKEMQPTPVFLPGKPPEQRSLVGYNPWSCRVGHDLATKPLPPFEHRIPHKNLVGWQSAHGFCTWRTESSLIPSGRVHQQWEAGSGVGWGARDEKRNGVLLGPAALLNPRGLLLMRVTVIKLKKTCQDPFFLCSLKNVFFPSRCPFYELEKVLIKETSPSV